MSNDFKPQVTVEYTKEFILTKSSFVEGIYYNGNDRSCTVDLGDRIYRYRDVDVQDVYKVVNAESAGREYTNFRRKYGPGESLGSYYDIYWKKVEIRNVDLSFDRTGNFKYTSTQTVNEETPKYHSIKFKFKIVQQNMLSATKSHTLVASDINDGVKKMKEIADMLDLEFKLVKATVKFVV